MNTQPSLALINCPACDKQVSSKAVSCPHCGHPLAETESPPKMTQAEPSASPPATVQGQPVAQAEPSVSQQAMAQPQPAVRAQAAAKSDFTIGQILGSTVSTLLKEPLTFFLDGVCVGLPSVFLLGLFLADAAEAGGDEDMLIQIVIQTVVVKIFIMCGIAQVARVVFMVLRRETIETEDLLVLAPFLKNLRLAGAAALVGLVIGLGTMCFFIPGVFLSVILALTIPVYIVERPGVVESMKRSAELTKGYRLSIFGLYLIIGLLTAGLDLLFEPTIDSNTGIFRLFILPAMLNAPFLAFNMVMTVIIYFKLREVKEGATLDSMAGAFEVKAEK